MNALLTGATGFIGSHVARRLLGEGWRVYALVRADADDWRIRDVASNLHTIRGDLLRFEELGSELERIQPDLCVHCAWYVSPGKYLSARENLEHLAASARLVARLAEIGCLRFVGLGTCLEYDTGIGHLSETTPTLPGSLYAASKLALQLVLEQLSKVTGMEVAWARLFYQFGPFEDARRLVPSVILSLLHDREARITSADDARDYLHVEDVASAIVAIAKSDLKGPVNIGSGVAVPIREIALRIGTLLDKRDLIAFDPPGPGPSAPAVICSNNERLRKGTGWLPHYDLDGALRATIAWWKRSTTPSPLSGGSGRH